MSSKCCPKCTMPMFQPFIPISLLFSNPEAWNKATNEIIDHKYKCDCGWEGKEFELEHGSIV